MKDHVIVITGASAGIGRALALDLANRGAKLVLAARSLSKLETLVTECEALGATALAVPTDVGNEEACRALIEKTIETHGRLDTLVNNAGISMSVSFEKVEETSVFERLMRVNYLGTVWLTFYALPHLKASKGMVVGVSSLQGRFGFPRSTGYCASKHAVQGFFDSLRIEVAAHGMAVLVVSPGAVATEIHNRKLVGSGDMVRSEQDFSGKKQMSAARCAELIANAMLKRQRELVMTAGGKLAVWLYPFMPGFVDRQVSAAVEGFYRE